MKISGRYVSRSRSGASGCQDSFREAGLIMSPSTKQNKSRSWKSCGFGRKQRLPSKGPSEVTAPADCNARRHTGLSNGFGTRLVAWSSGASPHLLGRSGFCLGTRCFGRINCCCCIYLLLTIHRGASTRCRTTRIVYSKRHLLLRWTANGGSCKHPQVRFFIVLDGGGHYNNVAWILPTEEQLQEQREKKYQDGECHVGPSNNDAPILSGRLTDKPDIRPPVVQLGESQTSHDYLRPQTPENAQTLRYSYKYRAFAEKFEAGAAFLIHKQSKVIGRMKLQ
eukprot:284815136_5